MQKDPLGAQTAISTTILIIIQVLLYNTDSLLAITFGVLAVFFSGIAMGVAMGKKKG